MGRVNRLKMCHSVLMVVETSLIAEVWGDDGCSKDTQEPVSFTAKDDHEQ